MTGYFLLYTVTGRNIALTGTPVTYYCWALQTQWYVHFLLTEKKLKRATKG